jgi:hypothetical protein
MTRCFTGSAGGLAAGEIAARHPRLALQCERASGRLSKGGSAAARDRRRSVAPRSTDLPGYRSPTGSLVGIVRRAIGAEVPPRATTLAMGREGRWHYGRQQGGGPAATVGNLPGVRSRERAPRRRPDELCVNAKRPPAETGL